MSPRSIYFRTEAQKCIWHAGNVLDPEIQDGLKVLAAAYIMRAVAIENEESRDGARR
jgi:hypothetical protein